MSNRPTQPALPDTIVGGRKRVYCKGPTCPHELTSRESRARGYGAVCDPDNHPDKKPHGRVDQDPIPGTEPT